MVDYQRELEVTRALASRKKNQVMQCSTVKTTQIWFLLEELLQKKEVHHGGLYVHGVAQEEEDFVVEPPMYTAKITVRLICYQLYWKSAGRKNFSSLVQLKWKCLIILELEYRKIYWHYLCLFRNCIFGRILDF